MKKCVVKNIEIYYDEEQENKLDYIKMVLENNFELLSRAFGDVSKISLVPIEDAEFYYIENFDTFFEEVVIKMFKEENFLSVIDNPELLPNLYVGHLIKNLSSEELSLVQSSFNVSDEIFYSIIAYKYFQINGSFEEFVRYLKYREGTEDILLWLKNEARWPAYNGLIKALIDYFKEDGDKFLPTICEMVDNILMEYLNNMSNQLNESLNDNEKKEEVKIQLPMMLFEDLDSLFVEFLKCIKAPEDWMEMYENLKNNNRIIIKDQSEGLNESCCYGDKDGFLKILLTSDGTIRVFRDFVHEFAHYIALEKKSEGICFSVSEVPSIFFERLSAEFLKSKGYSADVVNAVIEQRFLNNMEIYADLGSLFTDIKKYVKHGVVTKEEKVQMWRQIFDSMQETKEKIASIAIEAGVDAIDLAFLDKPKIDIKSCVDGECDELIDDFVKHGFLVINGYQYIFGTFVAKELLKRCNDDPSIVVKMIKFIDEPGNMNLQDLVNIFEIQDLFEKMDKGISKTRKLN